MSEKNSAKGILNDENAILNLDPNGMFADESRFSENLNKAIENVKDFELPEKIMIGNRKIQYGKVKNVVFVGMGGSAIAGDLLKDWVGDRIRIPVETVRSYHLPLYADESTVVFLISYSGNTEETLSCMLDAVKANCQIISISSDGTLKRVAENLGLPIIGMPKMAAARVSLPYLFVPLAYFLAKLKILPEEMIDYEMSDTEKMITHLAKDFAAHVPSEKNLAKQLASKIFGTVPVIYSYGAYVSVGLRFKTQVNENCKSPAFFNAFPELNHNEIMGWEASKRMTKQYTLILFRSNDEPEEVKTRIDALKRIFFDKKAKSVIELQANGETRLTRMFNLLFTADMISIYLAVLYRRDPVASKTFQLLKYEVPERLQSLEKFEQEILKLAKV